MLTCLRVQHLAIIDRLELELGPGFNVVTGETGAGKSILVAALQLVLGARARPEIVRTDCDEATIEALFDVPDTDPVHAVLKEHDLYTGDDEIVIRRIVKNNGRSRATVNGRLATLAQLKDIAARLVDISSQHEHTTLVDASTHLHYVDAFGGHQAERTALGQAFVAARDAERALEDLRARLRERAEREDLLRFQMAELDRLDPQEGEVAALEVERERLRHGERLVGAAGRAAEVLDGDDRGVCDRLGAVQTSLEDAGRYDEALAEIATRIDAASTELRELAYDLVRYVQDIDLDPDRLLQVEERVAALKRLLRRFGGDESALLQFRDDARGELAGLDALESQVEAAEVDRDDALRRAGKVAQTLSRKRRAVADRLATAITGELRDLGMGHAHVEIEVAPLVAGDGELAVEGARLTAAGIDRAEFLIAPNPGEVPRPLARVASGGELSRALLAVKRVLAGLGPVGLYVFDEVDTGVGGAVAEAIGRKISEVARHHQVFCITHQPQIAAFGDTHLYVHKQVHDGRTRSGVRGLDAGERQGELARMLGGATVTDAAHEAAGDLLRLARESR